MKEHVFKKWHKLSRGEFFIGYRYNRWLHEDLDEDLRWSEYATEWRIQIGFGWWLFDYNRVKYDDN